MFYTYAHVYTWRDRDAYHAFLRFSCIFSYRFLTLPCMNHTPELLSKKHLNFGQGLEFLKFGQGNRGLNQENRRHSKETIRKHEGKR